MNRPGTPTMAAAPPDRLARLFSADARSMMLRPAIIDPTLSMVPMQALLGWLGAGPVAAATPNPAPPAAQPAPPAAGPAPPDPAAAAPAPAPEPVVLEQWGIADRWTLPQRRAILRRPNFIVSPDRATAPAATVWDFAISRGAAPPAPAPHALSNVPAALKGELPPPLVLPSQPQPQPQPQPQSHTQPQPSVPASDAPTPAARSTAAKPALPPPLILPSPVHGEPWEPPAEEAMLNASGHFIYGADEGLQDHASSDLAGDGPDQGHPADERPPGLIADLPPDFAAFRAAPRRLARTSAGPFSKGNPRRARTRIVRALPALVLGGVMVVSAGIFLFRWLPSPRIGTPVASAPAGLAASGGLSGIITGPLRVVSAPVDGTLVALNVTLDSVVAEGTPLFSIAVAPDTARLEALTAQRDDARQKAAQRDQRLQDLARPPAASRPLSGKAADSRRGALLQARTEAANAAATVTALERDLAQEIGRSARSPADTLPVEAEQPGMIGRFKLAPGAAVRAGMPVLEMVDCGQLVVTTDAAAAAAHGLVAGQKLRLRPQPAIPSAAGADPAVASTGTLFAHMPAAPPRAGRLIVPLDEIAARQSSDACPIGQSVTIEAQ